MVVMEEHKVKRYLDDLLIRLEVFGEDKEERQAIMDEFTKVLNFYRNTHQSFVDEYLARGNEVRGRYEQ